MSYVRYASLNPPPKPPDDLLWHYTDFGAFDGMRQGNIRASEILYLNDSAECTYLIELAAQLMLKIPSPYPTVTEEALSATFRHWIPNYDVFTYVTCFSTKMDDLSQWRAYTRSPPGFALGFDRAILAEAAKSENFQLVECEYDLAEQEKLVTTIIKRQYASIASAINYADSQIDFGRKQSGFYNQALPVICRELLQLCRRCKSPAFRDEGEYRLVGYSTLEPKFRQVGSLIVPFVEWKFKSPLLPLKHIIVGPGPHSDEVIQVARRMCPGVGVSPSSVPFRNW
jgi:hypothetical protein